MKPVYLVLIGCVAIYFLVNNFKPNPTEHYGGSLPPALLAFINWFSTTPNAISNLQNFLTATATDTAGQVTFNNNIRLVGNNRQIAFETSPGVYSALKAGSSTTSDPDTMYVLGKQFNVQTVNGAIVGKTLGGNGNLTVDGSFTVASNTQLNGDVVLKGDNRKITFTGNDPNDWCGMVSGAAKTNDAKNLYMFGNLISVQTTEGVSVSKGWGGKGDLSVDGTLTTQYNKSGSYPNTNFPYGDIYQVGGGTSTADCKTKCLTSTNPNSQFVDTVTYQKNNGTCWCKNRLLSHTILSDTNFDTISFSRL